MATRPRTHIRSIAGGSGLEPKDDETDDRSTEVLRRYARGAISAYKAADDLGPSFNAETTSASCTARSAFPLRYGRSLRAGQFERARTFFDEDGAADGEKSGIRTTSISKQKAPLRQRDFLMC
jgi:hypothetical protein